MEKTPYLCSRFSTAKGKGYTSSQGYEKKRKENRKTK